ncbi:MAG: hypothetical protein JSU72_15430 [Deltaproteobacteria bacterium]|nr:MAG: hypothetical protein JSU72_15430 [Deltaproteobacteria bacterium]
MTRTFLLGAITLAALLVAQPVRADQREGPETPWARGAVLVGGFFSAISSDVRLGVGGVGLEISGEDMLGLDSTTRVFRVDAFYSFDSRKRHRVYFTWYDLSRSATTTALTDIPIDGNGNKIHEGSTVYTDFDLALYKLAYAYSFFQDDRFNVAFSVGAYVADVGIRIQVPLQPPFEPVYEDEALTAPLPVLGLRADFAFTPKLILRQSVELFYLEISDYRGHIFDVNTNLEYNIWKHFGMGIGFEFLDFELENDKGSFLGASFTGSVEIRFVGVQLYGKLYF